MTERKNNAFLNRKTIRIITALVILAAVLYSAYQLTSCYKGYLSEARHGSNEVARSNLQNAKACVEAYFADHHRYPETLEKACGKECCRNTPGVELSYERPGRGRYRIMSFHIEGDKEYRCSSGDPAVYWRYKKDQNGTWKTL